MWGHRGSKLVDIAFVAAVDVAVGRLDPFETCVGGRISDSERPSEEFFSRR